MVTAASVLGITKATAAPKVTIDHAKHDKLWNDFVNATGLQAKEFQMLSAKLLTKHTTIYRLDFELGLSFHGQEHIEHYMDTIKYGEYAYSVDYYVQGMAHTNSRIVVKRIEREDLAYYERWESIFTKEFS